MSLLSRKTKTALAAEGIFPRRLKPHRSNFGLAPRYHLSASSRAIVVVAMVAPMMMGLSKCGRAQQHNEGEQQSLFHAHIITSF
jgi:hypothetical protein